MSHPAQMAFVASVRDRFPNLFVGSKVLEVGSLNINGTIRTYFQDCDYLGVDIGPGNCVDLVARGEDLTFADQSFDVVASCECFEHNPKWVETFDNMARMSRSLVFFSCATTGRPEHGTSRANSNDAPFCGDYYANVTAADVMGKCDMSVFDTFEFSTNEQTHDLYFWGVKK